MTCAVEAPAQAIVAYDAYLFDMDGTIYLGDHLLPGVSELMDAITATGRARAFITNNPTRTRRHYAEKLTRLGLPATAEDVVTSGTLTAAWVKEHLPDAVCFVLGEPPLLAELAALDIALSQDPVEITLVISSYDRTFDYRKLQVAFDALRGRPEVGFIATHPDPYCPFPDGRGEPDAAAITAAIEACTGRLCEQIIGKPSPEAITTTLSILAVSPERAIMVGDRLRTDIAMGIAAGTHTALVLSGDSSMADLLDTPRSLHPDLVLERIDLLAAPLLAEGAPR